MNSSTFNNLLKLCLYLMATSVAYAESDNTRYASGKPETILAEVRIGVTTLSDMTRMYGTPTKIEYPNQYTWVKPCLVLFASAYDDGIVNSMNLSTPDWESGNEGTCNAETVPKGAIVETGRGLRLKDDASAWNRIYGNQLGLATESGDCCCGEWEVPDPDPKCTKSEFHACELVYRFSAGFIKGKVSFFLLEQRSQ